MIVCDTVAEMASIVAELVSRGVKYRAEKNRQGGWSIHTNA
jgi:hypothetical protein